MLAHLPFEEGPPQTPRQVMGAIGSHAQPTPVANPRLLVASLELMETLGLDASDLDPEVLAGNRLFPGSVPTAACYGGHQFGNWAGQLGDGRAISLGDLQAPDGRMWELQLKGAGPTPYSRGADGRAVLRSSVREFLCSEAMHHLGVPTTRALSLVATGDDVVRDILYDGNPAPEPGAIVCRVSPSFLRLGNFELLASRRDHALLERLTSYTLETYFPHLGERTPASVVAFLREVCTSTAELMAHWMRVGFVHGVMNTDNLSVLGLTIDYGPYGWLEGFDPNWTPNTTDAGQHRYAYGRQPAVAMWNLTRFAEALYPMVGETEPLEEALGVFAEVYTDAHARDVRAKLGLFTEQADDPDLFEGLMTALQATETDFTLFYRRLSDVPVTADASEEERLAPLQEAIYDSSWAPSAKRSLDAWLERYAARVRTEGRDASERVAWMQQNNPWFVLRNYLAHEAITLAEAGDVRGVERLMDALKTPYMEQKEASDLGAKRPEWARHKAGCSMLSCSS